MNTLKSEIYIKPYFNPYKIVTYEDILEYMNTGSSLIPQVVISLTDNQEQDRNCIIVDIPNKIVHGTNCDITFITTKTPSELSGGHTDDYGGSIITIATYYNDNGKIEMQPFLSKWDFEIQVNSDDNVNVTNTFNTTDLPADTYITIFTAIGIGSPSGMSLWLNCVMNTKTVKIV